MKKIIALLLILPFLACKTDDNATIEGGDILAEYTIDSENSGWFSRHTFKDNGSKFDQVFGPNEVLDRQYSYDGQGRLASVEGNIRTATGNLNGTESFTFTYLADGITIIYERSGSNEGNGTTTNTFEYDGNDLIQYSGSDPDGLFAKKYEFDDQGWITKIETYSGSGNAFDYFIKDFEYDASGRLVKTSSDIGTYFDDTDIYSQTTFENEYYDYFNNSHPNPLQDAMNGVYLNYILAPDAFSSGLFRNGAHGAAFDNFLQRYSEILENIFQASFVEIRDENITFQTNGLPKSGFRGVGGTPFEFIYSE